jgi:hypothetical protein
MHIASPLFVSLRRLLPSLSRPSCLPSSPVSTLGRRLSFVSFVTFVSFVRPPSASAQPADAVGVRAQGMGGAFTAVADDATATWWNPAGLAGGSYFSSVLEYGHLPNSGDATDKTVKGLSIAFPALGLSYYRLPISEMRPATSTGQAAAIRQDQGTLSELGVTVGQSLGNHFVIGSTLKVLNAGQLRGGLDLGGMVTFGMARIGVSVRNVTEPTFGEGADALALKRQARAGFALSTGPRGVIGTGAVAVDADLTTTVTAAGEQRWVAVGGEIWTTQRVLGLRGGVSRNLVGSEETSLSGGASVAFRRQRSVISYVDGQVTGGSEAPRSWSVGLRVTF